MVKGKSFEDYYSLVYQTKLREDQSFVGTSIHKIHFWNQLCCFTRDVFAAHPLCHRKVKCGICWGKQIKSLLSLSACHKKQLPWPISHFGSSRGTSGTVFNEILVFFMNKRKKWLCWTLFCFLLITIIYCLAQYITGRKAFALLKWVQNCIILCGKKESSTLKVCN